MRKVRVVLSVQQQYTIDRFLERSAVEGKHICWSEGEDDQKRSHYLKGWDDEIVANTLNQRNPDWDINKGHVRYRRAALFGPLFVKAEKPVDRVDTGLSWGALYEACSARMDKQEQRIAALEQRNAALENWITEFSKPPAGT